MKKFLYVIVISLILLMSSCQSNKHFITKFIPNLENSEIKIKDVKTNKEGKINEPNVPSIEGYNFVGWYSDLELTVPFDFDTILTRDLTLYGKWEKVKPVIIIMNEDEELRIDQYNYGDKVTNIKEPTLKGHTFVGLYYDQELTKKYQNEEIILKEDLTLYTKWQINKLNLKLNVSGEEETFICDYDTKVKDLPLPTKTNYTFDGWYSDQNFKTKLNNNQSLQKDMTLYGRFSLNKYRISYYDGKTLMTTQSVPYQSKLNEVFNLKKEGYEFLGLFQDEECTKSFSDDFVITKDTKVYVKWRQTEVKVTLYVDGKSYQDVNVGYGNQISTIKKPTKTYYTLDGWYSDVKMTKKVTDTTVVKKEMTLYGKFVTATYDIKVYDGTKLLAKYSLKGGNKLSSVWKVKKDGYTLLGIYQDESFKKDLTLDFIPTSSINIYTKWQINTYQITFVTDDKKETITKKYQETISDIPNPTKNGYIFLGWFTSLDYVTEFTKTTKVTKDITLYACFVEENKVPYKIVYLLESLDSKKNETKKEVVLYGKAKEEVKADILTFEGFTPVSKEIKGIISTDKMLVLEVKYTRNSYNISYVVDGKTIKTIKQIKYGTTYEIEDIITDDYLINGWHLENDSNSLEKLVISKDTKLIATFEKIFSGSDGLIYELNDDEKSYQICGYIGQDTEIIIPNGYLGYPITKITYLASAKITKITMSDHISVLDVASLAGNINLKTVILSTNLLTIKENTFLNCENLEEITIPSSVTMIEAGAFNGCKKLNKITVINNLIYQSLDNVLINNKEHLLVLYPSGKTTLNYQVPNDIKTILPNAFLNNDYLNTLTILDNVTSVGLVNFNNLTSLTKISFGKNVTNLSENCLLNTPKLISIEVDINNQFYTSLEGVLYNKNMTTLIKYPTSKIDTNFEILKSVTLICYHAFENITNLQKITFKSDLSLSKEAFYNVKNLIIYAANSSYSKLWSKDAFSGSYQIIYQNLKEASYD